MRLVLALVLLSPLLQQASCEVCDSSATSAISLALDHGDADTAQHLLDQASRAGCPATTLLKARIAAANDKVDDADVLFQQYLALSPDDPEGAAHYALLLLANGDYVRAEALIARAAVVTPHDPVTLAGRGQLLAIHGDKQGAVEALSEAARLDPENAEAEFQLGIVFDRAKLPAEAVQHFRRSLALDSNDARAWDYLALNLEPLGEIAQASHAYQRAIEVNHQGATFDSFVDYNYGRFLTKQNDLIAGCHHLDLAVEHLPDLRAAWYERSRVSLLLGNYLQARQDAETALHVADSEGNLTCPQIPHG